MPDKDNASDNKSDGLQVGRIVFGGDTGEAIEIQIGDNYNVGNIVGSTGIAIGVGASASVTYSSKSDSLETLIAEILAKLELLNTKSTVIDDVKEMLVRTKDIYNKSEDHQDFWFTRMFRDMAHMGPDILDVVTAALLGSGTVFSETVRNIARKARDENGLSG